MKTLPKILCIISLLSMSGLVWTSCPEGYEENDRTGECKAIPGFKEKVEAEKKEQEYATDKEREEFEKDINYNIWKGLI